MNRNLYLLTRSIRIQSINKAHLSPAVGVYSKIFFSTMPPKKELPDVKRNNYDSRKENREIAKEERDQRKEQDEQKKEQKDSRRDTRKEWMEIVRTLVLIGGMLVASRQYLRNAIIDDVNELYKLYNKFHSDARNLRLKLDFIDPKPGLWLLEYKAEKCDVYEFELKELSLRFFEIERSVSVLQEKYGDKLKTHDHFIFVKYNLENNYYPHLLELASIVNASIRFYQKKKKDKALALIQLASEKAINFEEKYSTAISKIPDHHEKIDDFDEMEFVLKLHASIYNLEAMILRLIKENVTAETSYLKVVEKIEKIDTSFEFIEKKYNKAKETLEKIKKTPDDSIAYIFSNIGFLYNELNRPAEALLFHRKANNIMNNDPAILNGLAFGYFQIGFYESSISRYMQALEYSKNNVIILSNLGWLLYEMELYDESIRYLSKIVDMDTEPTIYPLYYRSLAYVAQGKYCNAKNDLKTAMVLSNDNEHSRQAIMNVFSQIEKLEIKSSKGEKIIPSLEAYPNPSRFVFLRDIAPMIKQDMRYASKENFVGRVISGYPNADKKCCMLLQDAAKKILEVESDLNKRGLELLIYDCYRPQQATNDVINWSKNDNEESKLIFYPNIEKKDLFKEGYLNEKSIHSSGLTVDVTILNKHTGEELDMGTKFDFMDVNSGINNKENITEAQLKNRQTLCNIMKQKGFVGVDEKWWQFTFFDTKLQHFVSKNDEKINKYPQFFDFKIPTVEEKKVQKAFFGVCK